MDKGLQLEVDPLRNIGPRKALLIAACLLAVLACISLPTDWLELTQRYKKLEVDQLFVAGKNLLAGKLSSGFYPQVYVFAAVVLLMTLSILILAGGVWLVPRATSKPENQLYAYVAVTLIVIVLLSLPVFVSDAIPKETALDDELRRAYRDAFGYMWISLLLLVMPAQVAAHTGAWARNLLVVAVAGVVVASYFSHLGTNGSRTNNEVVGFLLVLLGLSYLSRKVHDALNALRSAREVTEQALEALAEEKQKLSDQTDAAVNELRTALQKLEQSERPRTAGSLSVLGKAVHDLRGSIAAIGMYADRFAARGSSESAAPWLQDLKDEVSSLASRFNAIISYSVVEAGQTKVQIRTHRLRDVFQELEQRCKLDAEARGITIQFQPPPDACLVETDRTQLERVLGNIISNAIKYTPKAAAFHTRRLRFHVVVKARVRGLTATIYVIDRGSGIPKEDQGRIFEPGCRLTDDGEGYGIGLATVKALLDRDLPAHGIRLNSVVGRGSQFMVDVPRVIGDVLAAETNSQAKSDELSSANVGSLKGAVIAVVEDKQRVRAAIVDALEFVGAFVAASDSVAGIIDELKKLRPPNAILTDFHLQGRETGYEVIRRIREDFPGRTIPAIVFTADARAASDATADLANVQVIDKSNGSSAVLVRALSAHYTPRPSPLESLALDVL